MEENRSDSEEEDLEALRLAALATLKPRTSNVSEPESPEKSPKNVQTNPVVPLKDPGPKSQNPYSWRAAQARRGRGRGAFPKVNQRSNLIVITPVGAENDLPDKKETPAPQLLLPQHKWCQAANENSSSPKTYSKRGPTRFNRHESGSESSDSDYDNSDQDSYSNETILQDENSMTFQDESIDREGTPVTDEVNDNHRLNFPISSMDSAPKPTYKSSSNLDDPIQREPMKYSSYQYKSQQSISGITAYQNETGPVNGGSTQDFEGSRRRLSESNPEGFTSTNFTDPNLSQSDLRLELKRRMSKLRRQSMEGAKSESFPDKPDGDGRRTSKDSIRGYSSDRTRFYEQSRLETVTDSRTRNRSRSFSPGRNRSGNRSWTRGRSRSRSRSLSHGYKRSRSRSLSHGRNRSRSFSNSRSRSRSRSPRHSDRQRSGSRERFSKRYDRSRKRDFSGSPDKRLSRETTQSPDKNGKRSWSRSPVKTRQRTSASPNKTAKKVGSLSPKKTDKPDTSKVKSKQHDYIWSPEISKKQEKTPSPQRNNTKTKSKSPDPDKRHNFTRSPDRDNKQRVKEESPERTKKGPQSLSPGRKAKHSPDKSKKQGHTRHKRISPPHSSKTSRSSHSSRKRSSSRSPYKSSKARRRSRSLSPVRGRRSNLSRSPMKTRRKSPNASPNKKHKPDISRRDQEPRHKRNLNRSPEQKLKAHSSPQAGLEQKLKDKFSLSPKKNHKSPSRDHWSDSSESSERSGRDWRGKKNTSRRWSQSSSSDSDSCKDRGSRLKSISSVVKPVLSSVSAVAAKKDDRLPDSDYFSRDKDKVEEKPKALMSLVKSSVTLGENRNNAPEIGKRLPVHMRLGILPRNKLIRMTKDVEAAFVNSSSDDNAESGAEGKKQNFRVVADATNDASKRRVEKSPAKNESKSRRKKTYR